MESEWDTKPNKQTNELEMAIIMGKKKKRKTSLDQNKR